MITGKDLIAWGITPGPYYKEAIRLANAAIESGQDPQAAARSVVPVPPMRIPLQDEGVVTPGMYIRAETPEESANVEAVERTIAVLARTPTVRKIAVMPDACPAGPVGTIPVGGVVACEDAIHPGFHSADICCSLYMTNLGNVNPRKVMDAAMRLTHFGGGGRVERLPPPADILAKFKHNSFLKGLEDVGHHHFGTQGDGNHFLFVGQADSGGTCVVTHHGSRKLGAMVYKRGMEAAQEHTAPRCPDIPSFNSWIPFSSTAGEEYWEALQIVREWTKANHAVIHDMIADDQHAARSYDPMWNEHNFVFYKRDGLFYHGKGATPVWGTHADDSSFACLIPLSMSQPILIVDATTGNDDSTNGGSLGFAPTGLEETWDEAHTSVLSEMWISPSVSRLRRKVSMFASGQTIQTFLNYHLHTRTPRVYANRSKSLV